jgi:hypothetical protein
MSAERSRAVPLATTLLIIIVSLVPFARGLALGQSFFFRDLSGIFIPFREYVVEGVRAGELRYWNDLDHEGVPLPYPPVSYPFDLLQAVLPGPFGMTLLLALHVPLAALGLFLLARVLGQSRPAAAAAGLIYALGGFCLSSINLYVYIQGAAWVPLTLAALLRAAEGGRRWFAWAALAVAILTSTMTVEFLVQTLLVAGVLAARRAMTGRRLLRMSIPTVLGLAIAAPTLLTMRAVLLVSGRGAGLDPSVTLAQSVHPFTFLQVLVAGLYGDLANPANLWWGGNFFPSGFPYFVSLYLGAAVLALAWTGLCHGEVARRRLLLLVIVGSTLCLGRYLGIEPLVRALPFLGAVRYPAKAFLTVHLAIALLAGLGADALARRPDRAWRSLAAAGLGLCLLLVGIPRLLVLALPNQARWFVSAFFPPGVPWPYRLAWLGTILRDATVGGAIGGVVGLVGLAARFGRLRGAGAQLAVVALAVADLLRAGAGLNSMTRTSFFRLSEEMAPVAAALRQSGRVWVSKPEQTRAYWAARAARKDHELWTFAVMIETFTPHLNMLSGVATAYTDDLTSLVPLSALPPGEATGGRFEEFASRLRQAAVTHVISLDPIDSPELSLERVVSPRRIAPLAIHVYRLARPLPRIWVASSVAPASDATSAPSAERRFSAQLDGTVSVEGVTPATSGATGRVLSVAERPGRIEIGVETDRPTAVVVRDTWCRGWTALVNGQPAEVLRANRLHRAVAVPQGRSTVLLEYRPPGLTTGVILSGLALIALALTTILGRPRADAPSHAPSAAKDEPTRVR